MFKKIFNLSFIFFNILSRLNPNYVNNKIESKFEVIPSSAFILTFDCDTELDIKVVQQVHTNMQKLGITPIYAVPGELLIRGRDIYVAIHKSGAEFINHGYKQHSDVILPDRKYYGTFFYEQESISEVIDDIYNGHETIKQILGFEAKGFRTPHFGGFQSSIQLKLLWKYLAHLGYSISSSTGPYFAYKNGAVTNHHGIKEIAVTSDPYKPWQILDSWSYGFSKKKGLMKQNLIEALNYYAARINSDQKFLLNIYADPSQIYDWPEFFEVVGKFAQINKKSFLEI